MDINEERANALQEEANAQLFRAANSGYIVDAKAALDAGGKVNAANSAGNTPLHIAITCLNRDVAALLVGHGAPIDAKNNKGELPIDLARNHRLTDTFDILQEAAKKQQGHIDRVIEDRKRKGPRQPG